MAEDLKEQAAREAHLPPFCTIVEAYWTTVGDVFKVPLSRKPEQVLCANFTFPGATAHGFWRGDLPGMATVHADDYETYQRLKADWSDGGQEDDGG